MENMWQFKVEESNQESPKALLEEQAKLLPSLTGDMVYATVVEDMASNFKWEFYGDFIYSVSIKSKFLPNYGFRILSISHSIPIYPVKIILDDDIKQELGLGSYLSEINSEEEFKRILRDVLSSKRIGTVISSIIKLSR